MQTIKVTSEQKTYEVVIDQGLRQKLGALVADVWSERKVLILTDETVGATYLADTVMQLRQAGFYVSTATLPVGEVAKSWEMAEKVAQHLLTEGFTRSDGLLALGGGVVTDLGGLVASLYMRGISLIQVPTSLLAQVDASVGGKTAVNLGETKNVLGTFYQPDRVIIDPRYLDTLSDRELAAGYAEVIKMSALAGEDFFALTGQIQNLEQVRQQAVALITASVTYKRDIVEMDTFDHGQRQILNFGHTFGHAMELLSDGALHHGEAVAVGMVAMSDRLERDGYTAPGTTDQLVERLVAVGLPVFSEYLSDPKLLDLLAGDKKRDQASVTLVGLAQIGEPILLKKAWAKLPSFIEG